MENLNAGESAAEASRLASTEGASYFKDVGFKLSFVVTLVVLTVIWVAEVREGKLTRWQILDDTNENRATSGLR
jgi:hypothetical protein